MTSVLGKRKSRVAEPKVAEEDAQEIFRRHFEAQFKPIRTAKKPKKPAQEEPDEEEASGEDADEWDGLSDDPHDDDNHTTPVVEVVDHTGSQAHDPKATMSKRELKAFMSSRPPSTDRKPAAPAAPEPDSDSDTERSLRAQDLALQRLLSESHLLSSYTPDTAHSTGASQKLFASGKLRHRTTDMRIQALGASSAPLAKAPDSLFEQKKMPMAMRKRIVATRGAREEKRRREAKENGIILEREKKKPAKDDRSRRDRTIDGPAVGRMRGAELRLSERDVRSIEGGGGRGRGPSRAGGGRGGHRGGR